MAETFAPSKNNLYLGRGVLKIALHSDAGVRGAYFHWGNVEDFEIRPATTDATIRSSMAEDSGVLAKDRLTLDFTAQWKNTEFNRKIVAAALSGTEAYYTQSSATVTGESLTASAELGGVYFTANRNISAVTLKQGATTLVAGTDYEVADATAGEIHLLPTGAATAGEALTADYTAAAISGTTQKIIQAGNRGQINCSIYFKGAPIRGPRREMRIWCASLSVADVFALINGNDYARMAQTATVINDAEGLFGGTTSDPYFRIYEL